MKERVQRLAHFIPCACLMLVCCMMNVACSESSLTDDTEFQLYYTDVTDIGPSMNMTLNAPTYIGKQPSEFTITEVKLNDAVVSNESFNIQPETGAITIENTNNLAIGIYSLSVACTAGGKRYTFGDIVHINMMRPVPQGITAEPNKITITYKDLMEKTPANLPSSQITTDGNHIHIHKYAIANIRHEGEQVTNDGLFDVSAQGLVTFGSKHTDLKPGKYIIDMKLTTAIVDANSQEGIFANAIEVDITSEPLSLNYTPDNSKVEVGATDEMKSAVPVMIGSREQLKYQIAGTTPANVPVKIDPATGELSLGRHSLAVNTECHINVTVSNQYGSKTFENVYTYTVVPLIRPITKLAYADKVEFIEGAAGMAQVKEVDGDERYFEFANLPESLKGQLKIDSRTGDISVEKGHSIAKGIYNIVVKVSNAKGFKEAGIVLNVIENVNLFTFVNWGNNLDLSPAKNYASQYRITSQRNLVMKVVDSDIKKGAKVIYAIDKDNSSSTATIDENTGEITFTDWKDGKVLMVMIETITGKGTSAEVRVKTPVFVHCSSAVKGVTVNYTPFVFQVNPQKGGLSKAPELTGANTSTFLMDYRRNFNYYNIGGPASHVTGQLKTGVTNAFIYKMWQNYYGDAAVNTGARKPVSYYDNLTSLSSALCYVDATNNCAVKVNPNKWMADGDFANGVFIGQMTFTQDGKPASVASGAQIFPLAIWFSTDF